MDVSSVIRIFERVGELKDVTRTGWERIGIPDPESVADHSYRMAVMAMLCTPEELDRDKCIRMALVHDLAETEVGDLTPHDTVENVEEKEAEAMRSFGSDELYELWDEYRRRETQEARFVKDLDELEMLFQATEYAREHDAEYDEFWDNADKHITTARGRELFRTIRTQS